MKKMLLLLLMAMQLCACSSNSGKQDLIEEPIVEMSGTNCSSPQCVIYLQPYENFTSEEANKLKTVLQDKFGSFLHGYWEFKLLPTKKLPSSTYVKEINRYKATAILNYEKSLIKGHEMIIGLTHKDICMNIHGKQNYGIIGCSYRPGQVCIVSDKRVKNKNDFWKPVIHEFIHGFYGADHCPEDNDSCIMQDGKGKGDFSHKDILCISCKH